MERREVRRRLVQSTLFPQSGASINGPQNCDTDGVDIVLVEEHLNCSSKKRRENWMSLNQKSTNTPSSEVIKNIVATSSEIVEDSSSPRKASQQLKEHQDELVDSPEEANKICSHTTFIAHGRSPHQKKICPNNATPSKEKKNSIPRNEKRNSTPRNESRSSTPNKRMKSCKDVIEVIPFDLSKVGHTSQAIPNLRLEAIVAAEETSRIFAGRKTHPFFKFWKGVTGQHVTHLETSEKRKRGLAFHPIHVLQNSQDEHGTLDWGCWDFSETSVSGTECELAAAHKGYVGPLQFDGFLNLAKKAICSEGEREHGKIFSESTEFLQEYEFGRDGLHGEISCDGSFKLHVKDKVHMERIMSHDYTTHCQQTNSLWTDKYRPLTAKQICGNGDSVESITKWLLLWHKKDISNYQLAMDNNDFAAYDSDHSYQQSDSEENDVDNGWRNVLLVTGPVGSGKSASIYACARDQGFRIIEINASDWRSGSLVKRKFGEATESHWLQGRGEAEKYSLSPSTSIKDANVSAHCSDDEVTELMTSDEGISQDASRNLKSVLVENSPAYNLSETKAIILFEDVDASLPEDHGFITTVKKLAATAKRPIILTSNSGNPVLPKNLSRSRVRFTVPPTEELLALAYVICAAEKARPHPSFVERCVQYCQGDIRKTILLLQFWWQGLKHEKGKKLQSTYSPVLFDVDAGHDILPSVIPSGYPSQLSEVVAEEVDKSLNMTIETYYLAETRNGLDDLIREKSCAQDARPESSVLKKEIFGMRSLGGPEADLFDLNFDPFNVSSTIASSKRNRRKFILGPSDSEDDGSYNTDAEVPHPENGTASNCTQSDVQQIPMEQTSWSGADKLGEFVLHLPERLGIPYLEDPCKTQDMPLLATSSVAPETEFIQQTKLYSAKMSYCPSVSAETNFAFDQTPLPVSEPTVGSRPTSSHILHSYQETLESICGTGTEAALGQRVGDSYSQSEADLHMEYQPLDECSRMDFVRKCKSLDIYEANQPNETWKKLYDQRQSLRNYVTAEEKGSCQVLKMAHCLTALISEADLLFSECQAPVCDFFESAVVLTEKIYDYGYSQMEMSSVVAEHGMCLFAKEIASFRSLAEPTRALDLASEMLTRSRSPIALGKLASLYKRNSDTSEWGSISGSNLTTSNPAASVCNVFQTLLPSKSYLTEKGGAFHEYMSTLSQISRYETCRLSDFQGSQKQRRARVPRHYLSSGSFALSSEEISRFGGFGNYIKSSNS